MAAASVAPINNAHAIALAMREFVNQRTATEEQVQPFLEKIGGYATLFGLVVSISDSLHLQLVRRVLVRLFDASPGGRARLCSPEVAQYLLGGLHPQQLKHVRLLTLQMAHLFMQDQQGQERLLQDDLFLPLVDLLEGDDVDVTEEVLALLRKLGSTPSGVAKILSPPTIERMFSGVIDGPPERRPRVVNAQAKGEEVMEPFAKILRAQHGAEENPAAAASSAAAATSSSAIAAPAAASAAAPELNSVILLRVMTLLTHIACATRLPGDASGPQSSSPSPPADSAAAAASLASVQAKAWELFRSQGLFSLLLQLASIAPSAHADMLVQLNGLELLEEIVAGAPQVDEAFATQLTRQVLQPALDPIRRAAVSLEPAQAQEGKGLIPTSGFVTVGVLRVFNKLASVSAARGTHQWYRDEGFLLFLSAAFNTYDEEAVQSEAIDLLTTLASFGPGLDFFSKVTSALPSSAVAAPAKQAAYLSNAYAASETTLLLLQVPFFVVGSNYSNGLRQLAAMHGTAKMLATPYAETDAPSATAGAEVKSPEPSAAPAAASVSAAPSHCSQLLRTFFFQLSVYANGKSPLDVLLTLAKQPFEDLREAVWKIVRALVNHKWGVETIAQTGGFIEYLLDRKTEFHVSGTQAKFDVLQALRASPYAATALAANSRKQIDEYVRQGAHYAPLSVGVMGPVAGMR